MAETVGVPKTRYKAAYPLCSGLWCVERGSAGSILSKSRKSKGGSVMIGAHMRRRAKSDVFVDVAYYC